MKKASEYPDTVDHIFINKNWKLQTIYTRDGTSKYMTRLVLGKLRFHLFHRGDEDEHLHDHPWAFWTFPLTSYVEETPERRRNLVPAFSLSFRPATYKHRVLGPNNPDDKKILTIVWTDTSKTPNPWGFFVGGKKIPPADYVNGIRT